MFIQLKDINKHFGKLHVLKDINLEIRKGEVFSVVGPSGAGKTTLLQIIGTLDKADSGSLLINDVDVLKLSGKKLSAFRNKNIGFIFQFHNLLPEFTASENVALPLLIGGKSQKQAFTRAQELLDILGLASRVNHKPSELSGGEQQRVAVARALSSDPAIVLADEPSGNLDTQSAHDLHQLFFDLRSRFNQTFVIVTHNNDFANMADQKIELKDGMIVNSVMKPQS